ncbi:hypothetical protein [Cellvibrio sp.]|jgi:hypothetical protein
MNAILDQIADAYVPLLLAIALGVATVKWMNGQRWFWLRLVASALLVYGLMLADNRWHWWSTMGLDYSTHTAAALSLAVFIGVELRIRLVWILLGTSLLAYGELMFYLGYHTWRDMGATAAVIGAGLWLIYRAPLGRLGHR